MKKDMVNWIVFLVTVAGFIFMAIPVAVMAFLMIRTNIVDVLNMWQIVGLTALLLAPVYGICVAVILRSDKIARERREEGSQ